MKDALDRLYRWYVLGCRLEERQPLSRVQFEDAHLLRLLSGGLLANAVFDRTRAEWELAREDAVWTTILNRLRNMNLVDASSDLVAAINLGRNEDEDGPAGSAGIPAWLRPNFPLLSGSAALDIPRPSPPLSDLVGAR